MKKISQETKGMDRRREPGIRERSTHLNRARARESSDHSQMTSAKFSRFWTPSPPCWHFTIEITQTPFLWSEFAQPPSLLKSFVHGPRYVLRLALLTTAALSLSRFSSIGKIRTCHDSWLRVVRKLRCPLKCHLRKAPLWTLEWPQFGKRMRNKFGMPCSRWGSKKLIESWLFSARRLYHEICQFDVCTGGLEPGGKNKQAWSDHSPFFYNALKYTRNHVWTNSHEASYAFNNNNHRGATEMPLGKTQ